MSGEELRAALRAVLRDYDHEPPDDYLPEAERIFRAALAAPSTPEPSGLARDAGRRTIRAAISNAYYESRDAGATMEAAADHATANICDLLEAGLGSALRAAPSTPEPSGRCGAYQGMGSLRGCNLTPGHGGHHEYDEREGLRAAPSTEPALDVERLAEAIRATDAVPPDPDDYWRSWAQILAAEYARLAESQS